MQTYQAQKPKGVQHQKNIHSPIGLRMLSVREHQCMHAVVCFWNARMQWGVSAQHATTATNAL